MKAARRDGDAAGGAARPGPVDDIKWFVQRERPFLHFASMLEGDGRQILFCCEPAFSKQPSEEGCGLASARQLCPEPVRWHQ